MPRYEYKCSQCKKKFEEKGGYEQKMKPCPRCGKKAHRQAVYRGQGVVFSGEGFTRQVIIPSQPKPKSTAKEGPDIAFEMQDEYAKKHYEDSVNVEPYRRERKKKGL